MDRHHEIFEKLPVGVTLHDASDGTIVAANEQFCEMLGYSREELLELDFDALHVDEEPYTSERAAEYIREAAQSGPLTFEWVDVTKDGERVPVEVSLRRTDIDDQGRILAVVRDISERKRRERELHRERDRFTTLFEDLGEPVVEVRFDGEDPIVADVNAAFEGTFAIDEATAHGQSVVDLVVPDSQVESGRQIARRVGAGEVVETELDRTETEADRMFLLRTVPYALAGEQRAFAIFFDITERQRQQERFQAFIQQSTDIISVLNPDGTYQYVSPSLERILGYDPAELVGENAYDYFHPDDRAPVMETFSKTTTDESVTPKAEYRFKHADGSWVWLESIGNNQLDNPAIEGVVTTTREITARKSHEQALERQNTRLEEFAGIVSHDLQTPLNVAQGRLELAQEDYDSEHLEAVARAHDRMETLIEDLLELARAGEDVQDVEPVELGTLSRQSWETVATGSATLAVDAAGTVEADRSQLRHLFENLFRNTVDHAREDVHVRVGDLADGFYVADDGPGVPESERDEVFEPGYSTSSSGTGLGLNIVRNVAAAHDWDIRVTEGDEGGARFEITGVETVAGSG